MSDQHWLSERPERIVAEAMEHEVRTARLAAVDDAHPLSCHCRECDYEPADSLLPYFGPEDEDGAA